MNLDSLASKGIQKSYFLFICGELALGENCIKIISQDKSNSLGMFLEIQRDIRLKCLVTASFMLTCRNQFHAKSFCLSVREKSMVLLSI